MLALQFNHLGARSRVGELRQGLQLLRQSRLLGFVDGGLAAFLHKQILGRDFPQQTRDAGIRFGCLAKATPHVVPAVAAGEQGRAGLLWVGIRRIEAELALADIAKRGPASPRPALHTPRGVVHPHKHVPHRIAHHQPVKVLRLQPPTLQARYGFVDQRRQRPLHGLTRSGIERQVESHAVLGGEERLHRPVAPVALVPHGAAVFEFDQGLEQRRTLRAGPQDLTADPRQIEHRDLSFLRADFRQRARHDAL